MYLNLKTTRSIGETTSINLNAVNVFEFCKSTSDDFWLSLTGNTFDYRYYAAEIIDVWLDNEKFTDDDYIPSALGNFIAAWQQYCNNEV